MESHDHSAGRRRFLNWFLGTAVGALFVSIAYPVSRFVSPPRVPEASTNQVDAGVTNDPEFMEKGFKIIRFGAEPVIVVKVAETDFRAFTATCTHLDCVVEFQKPESRIWCNCHSGQYDLQGRNVAGPPPRPLTPYKVDLIAGTGGAPGSVVVSKA